MWRGLLSRLVYYQSSELRDRWNCEGQLGVKGAHGGRASRGKSQVRTEAMSGEQWAVLFN